ncbi:MAG TPA: hypothetical protein VFB21_11495 [Chthonomonadaceae bacterium]|nr:hypothetical protein [Chthonomonadaceae bacterium]
MSDLSREENQRLAPGSLALVEAWLESQQAFAPPVVAARPSVDTLVRYLAASLSSQEVAQVERSLVAHAAARRNLLDVRQDWNHIQASSVAEVARLARNEDRTGQVARAWLTLMGERQGKMALALRLLASHGWEGVQRLIAEGDAAAQAAWTLVGAFGGQLQAAFKMPPRLATAKSGAAGLVAVVGAPEGISLEISEAEVETNGALRVSLIVQEAQGRATEALSGMAAHLGLRIEEDVCPIASGVIEGNQIAWNLAGLGSALGLPEGRLSPDYLHIALGEAAPPVPEKHTLYVEVVDARGAPTRRAVSLELRGEPRWEGGQFRVDVALLPEVRIAYETHRLLLSLAMTPQSEQQIGSWPLNEWSEEARTLTASCPDIPDAVLPAVALHARLAPAEG